MLKYYVPELGETTSNSSEVTELYSWMAVPHEPQNFAEAAAEFVHYNRSEATWPLTIVVLSDGVEAGRYIVARAMRASFSATPYPNVAGQPCDTTP